MIFQIKPHSSIDLNLKEIEDLLKEKLKTPGYSTTRFGIGYGKSIIVGKSFNVGARIYLKKGSIEIHPSFGNKNAIWLGVGAAFLMNMNQDLKTLLQKDVYELLNEKYGTGNH